MFVLTGKGPFPESITTDSAIPLAMSESVSMLRGRAAFHAGSLALGNTDLTAFLLRNPLGWETSRVGGEYATAPGLSYRITETPVLPGDADQPAVYAAPHCGNCGAPITGQHHYIGVGRWLHAATDSRWCTENEEANPDMKTIILPIVDPADEKPHPARTEMS